jgi:hypothetical protein
VSALIDLSNNTREDFLNLNLSEMLYLLNKNCPP